MPLPTEWSWIYGLVTENGRPVTLVPTGALVDSAKPWRGVQAGMSVGADAVMIPFRDRDVDGDTIRRGDQKAYLAPIDGVDMADMSTLIDADSSIWRIVSITKIHPGSDILLYILQLRR